MTPGIQSKLQRAKIHLEELQREFGRIANEDFHTISHQLDRESGIKSIIFEPLELPIEWSIIIGEFIHNLRSTLDQAVYFLTEEKQGSPLDMTEFPIYEDSGLFNRTDKKGNPARGGGLYKIRGLGPQSRTYIESIQPFNTRREDNTVSVLWFLQQLSNIDKHRTIHICHRHVVAEKFEFIRDVTFDTESFQINIPMGILKGQKIIAQWKPTANIDEEPDMDFDFTFDVAFDEPTAEKLAGQKVLPVCEGILRGVNKVITELDATR